MQNNSSPFTSLQWLPIVFLATILTQGCDTPNPNAEGTGLTSLAPIAGKADLGYEKAPAGPGAFYFETCSYDPEDPFEPRDRFRKGPYEGECLDTLTQRPVLVLKTPDAESSILRLANVFHDGGFWVAEIPTDAVYRVYFQLEYFPAVVPAGHTQLRVEFLEPVYLYGQSSWNWSREEWVDNLVLSVEAVPRVGDSYDLFNGMKDHFGLAMRVTSLEARYHSMITEQDHRVEQWILDLTEQEMAELLPSYAYESESMGLSETYHTLFQNCTTEAIRTLDGVVEYTWNENIQKAFTKFTEFYPNAIRAALIARGLLPLDQSTDWFELKTDPTIAFD